MLQKIISTHSLKKIWKNFWKFAHIFHKIIPCGNTFLDVLKNLVKLENT